MSPINTFYMAQPNNMIIRSPKKNHDIKDVVSHLGSSSKIDNTQMSNMLSAHGKSSSSNQFK